MYYNLGLIKNFPENTFSLAGLTQLVSNPLLYPEHVYKQCIVCKFNYEYDGNNEEIRAESRLNHFESFEHSLMILLRAVSLKMSFY